MIGEDELKHSLQCSMRPDVGIANDYRCDADIAMKVVRLGIVERSCIITSRQSSQLLMHLLLFALWLSSERSKIACVRHRFESRYGYQTLLYSNSWLPPTDLGTILFEE